MLFLPFHSLIVNSQFRRFIVRVRGLGAPDGLIFFKTYAGICCKVAAELARFIPTKQAASRMVSVVRQGATTDKAKAPKSTLLECMLLFRNDLWASGAHLQSALIVY